MAFSRARSMNSPYRRPVGHRLGQVVPGAVLDLAEVRPLNSSCRQTTCAPAAAACCTGPDAFLVIVSLSPAHWAWTNAARTTSAMTFPLVPGHAGETLAPQPRRVNGAPAACVVQYCCRADFR